MKLLDSRGRLFGKLSILDLGAGLTIALVIVGIFFFPGTTGSVAQVNATKAIEVDVLVQGLRIRQPEILQEELEATKSTEIIIRNQPYGRVEVKSVKLLPRTVIVPLDDGSVVARPDPRPEAQYATDWLITLGGQAQITKTGAVFGNNKIKIGTPVELEGIDYNFNASVIDVRVPN